MKDLTRKVLSDALNEVSPMLSEQVTYDDNLALWQNNGGIFDSLALVTFASTVETNISETLGKKISIVTDKAFSKQHSPFKSMETLGSFVEELLQETK